MSSTASFEDLVKPEPLSLTELLEKVAQIDKRLGVLNAEVDDLKKDRTTLEEAAVQAMIDQRLDGVKVAGRSWRIDYDHYVSVGEERKELVMRAAKAAGLDAELISVNTARLKSLLKEMAEGRDSRARYSDGTPFEGIVGEHVAPRLRHVTVR